jgi:enediyne biosynthesis protein E4
MTRFLAVLFLVAVVASLPAQPDAKRAAYPFVFKDVGESAGVLPHAGGIRGHGVAWGDADGDGWPELFVATFHNQGSKPGVFLRNEKGKFRPDPQEHLKTTGIGSGALFADLSNSGRLDLYVSNCAYARKGEPTVPSYLFRNDGGGKFINVSKDSGACPPNFEGRGLAVLDYDGDGLLDLVLCEQYYSPKVKTGARLFRNTGNYKFEDVSKAAGLPPNFGGLGVAVADLNSDGWPDIVLTGGAGDHRLLLNDGKGVFREAPGAREVFQWKGTRDDDPPAGVSIADVNRDGLPDIVIGHHFKSPWTNPAPIRLYLNRGVTDGVPKFEDVTEAAGLKPVAMKAPHVEINDFDNDGWPDIYVSIVKFADGKPCPVIYRNLGMKDGVPRFRDDAWGVNDFPTAEDVALKRAGPFFDKVLKDKKIIYMAAAPSCDFDRDGRLDLFLANWWIESPSLLLRNETPGGNWLDVRVEGTNGVNRMGVGAKVKVSVGGKVIGVREIGVGCGYCSAQEAVAHFGLGVTETVDVDVVLPHGKGTLTRKGVKANQAIVVR